MTSHEPFTWPLRDALRTAQSVLDGKADIIEGSITLARYGGLLTSDLRLDPDFRIFVAISSETDHLPFGEVRGRWSRSALERADAEIQQLRDDYSDQVRQACKSFIARFGPGGRTVALYRPVGPAELQLIEASGWSRFPPRLPDQPIFYPVTNEAYATQIARDWNVKASGAGFVTRFDVDAYYLSQYEQQRVGGNVHTEYWIPAEDLDEFNRNIASKIEVIAEFRRS